MKKLILVATAALLVAPATAGAATRDRTRPAVTYTTANGSIVVGGVDTIRGTARDTGAGIARVEVVAIPCNTQASDTSCGYVGFDLGSPQDAGATTTTCAAGRRSCTWSAKAPRAPGTYWVAATAVDRGGNESRGSGILRIVVV